MGEVAVRMVEPRRGPGMSEDAAVEQQARNEKAGIDAYNERHRDKIGKFLGHEHFLPWQSFAHVKDRRGDVVTVTRFYPVLNIALDIFPKIIGPLCDIVEERRQLLKAAGIRYGALDYGMALDDLIPQVGL